ncbi:MAG: LAGLIDADG family homing endonuclease [bacterium]|nr:LAGLIDADG family homing endonuclease [bacterium]
MAESPISDRVVFKHIGTQKAFILKVKNVAGVTWLGLADKLGVSSRTLTDWTREKFNMSYETANLMSKISGLSIPSGYKILNWGEHLKSISHKGGQALVEKQGLVSVDENYRKKQWRRWWTTKGKFESRIIKTLPFHTPVFSEKLAEFFGIMIGDGGMSKRQICITLHHVDDLEYSKFVVKLIGELFKVIPSVYHSVNDSVNDIVISRSGLVELLHSLGLPIGHKIKQGLDIPTWIKEHQKYQIACLRGLVDTDGSIFTHKYKVSGKIYRYKKICFSTVSDPLRKSVYKILKDLGFNPRVSHGVDIRLESLKDVKNYFALIGSHNQKHLNRYAKVS